MNKLISVALATLVLGGCAVAAPAGVQEAINIYCFDPYGFWGGTWHGMTTVFQFINSLVFDGGTVYAKCNTGSWYDFGYVGGAAFMFKTVLNILGALFESV